MNGTSGYYKIIPDFVMFDDELLTAMPKAILLYGEITALSNSKGYCWASNAYFAKKFKVSDRTITNYINKLVEKGFIARKIIYKPESKEVDKRILSINLTPTEIDFTTPGETDFVTPSEVDFTTPGEAGCGENNINSNNINVNREKGEEVNKQENVNIFDFLPSCGIYMSAINQTVLIDYAKKINQEVLIHAAKYTSEHATRPNFAYFRSILESYLQANIKTLAQAEAFDTKTEQQRNRSYNKKPTSTKSKWGGQLNEYDVTF